MRGLGAVFCFFFANQSFYLVMTLYMQMALQIPAAARPAWSSCRWPWRS